MKHRLLMMLCLITLISGCSLFTKTVGKTEYVYPKVPDTPSEPAYFPITWTKLNDKGLYCLDQGNAKNLEKDVVLLRGSRSELVEIINGLRSISTSTR